ncbi:hypothetical protein [Pandoraea pnomenusa]|nr:hypothetical protein [Pandoraea pnomenusa]
MPDIEDSPDKARRNLVTLSAVVWACAYLQPRIPAEAKLFGIVDVQHITPSRLWVALLLLLSYLLVRFIRSPAWSEAFLRWRDARERQLNLMLARDFEEDVREYLLRRTETDRLSIMAAASGQFPLLKPGEVETLQYSKQHLHWLTNRRSHAELELEFDFLTDGHIRRGSLRFNVRLEPNSHRSARFRAWAYSQLTSNLALEVHFALFMAIGAVGLTLDAFWNSCTASVWACIF